MSSLGRRSVRIHLTGAVRLGLALGVASLALVGAATGRPALRPAPGALDPRQMVLTGSDLHGARVTNQGYYKDADFPSVISYSREFEYGRIGETPLIYADSEAEVGTDPGTTAGYLDTVRRLLSSKAFANQFVKEFEAAAGSNKLVTVSTVSKPRPLGAGPGSFDVVVVVSVLGIPTNLHIAVFAAERVLGVVIVAGSPGTRVGLASVRWLVRSMLGHTGAQLAPRSAPQPLVAGTPQAAQTLTATPGTWRGAPATITYQWQRCDAAGSTCADIPPTCEPLGAVCSSPPITTAAGYQATWLDVGTTIRVSVTARNAYGMQTVVSAPTSAIVAAPKTEWPTSTSPPTVAGTPSVGSTLTADPGGWTHQPTSFTYSWMRCDTTSTPSCLPTGVHSQSYTVGATDQGSTLRVDVSAYNAAGGGSAASATTAPVG